MNRTIKGSKGPGYDYWSRRPHSGRGHGAEVKRLCHSVERQQAKGESRAGVAELANMDMDDSSVISQHP